MKEPSWPDMGNCQQSEKRFRENLELLRVSAEAVCEAFAFFGDHQNPGTAGIIALMMRIVQICEDLQKAAPEPTTKGDEPCN
jgi:hypothetical protein